MKKIFAFLIKLRWRIKKRLPNHWESLTDEEMTRVAL
jgi:hypothetical protein